MLSAVTYNIFLGRTFEPLFNWLFFDYPVQDLYCFQEFPEDKLDQICQYLTIGNYKSCFAPGFTWRGTTYGELTVFNANKLELQSSKTIALGGEGERHIVFFREGYKLEVKIARLSMDKSALLTDFKYGNQHLSLVNAHLCSDVYNSRKLSQVDLILERTKTNSPTIVLGDLNYPIGSGLSKRMSGGGFESVLEHQKTFRLGPGVYWQNDYIFQKQCSVQEAEVEKVAHSDHYPVFFKIVL